MPSSKHVEAAMKKLFFLPNLYLMFYPIDLNFSMSIALYEKILSTPKQFFDSQFIKIKTINDILIFVTCYIYSVSIKTNHITRPNNFNISDLYNILQKEFTLHSRS